MMELRLNHKKLVDFAIFVITVAYLCNPRFGTFDFGIITLTLGQLLSIVFTLIILLVSINSRQFNIYEGKGLVSLLMIWLIWSCASLLWTPDAQSGYYEIILLLFALILSFICFKTRSLKYLAYGWMTSYIINAGIGFWELISNRHLPYSDYVNDPGNYAALQSKLVLASFNNPNDYSSFLLLSMSIATFLYNSNKKWHAFIFVFFAVNIILLFYSAGRLGIIGSAIVLVFLLLINQRNINSFIKSTTVLILLSSIYIYAFSFGGIATEKITAAANSGSDESIETRLNLVKNGLVMLYESNGIGLGAGAFEYYSARGDLPFYTGRIINPHNLWIEILSQYGIGIFSIFLAWFISNIVKSYKNSNPNFNLRLTSTAIVAAICFTISVSQSSSAMNSPHIWVFLIAFSKMQDDYNYSN